jgi:molybdopterin converting factor small subunit
MSTQTNTTVRMFGALHSLRRERGLQSTTDVNIPPGGCAACALARNLDLPLGKIEAVFVNHVVHGLGYPIQAGDRVAFVPTGIPSPERLLLGIFRAGSQYRLESM